MTAIRMQVTTVGRQAAIAAMAGGGTFQPNEVELGEARYAPTAGQTALMSPFATPKRFTSSFAGVVTGSTTAEFSFQDVAMDAYNLGEIGLFGIHPTTNARILFAVASMADRFLDAKAANVASVWAVQVDFVGLDSVDATVAVTFPTPTFSVVFSTDSGARHFTLGDQC